MGKNIFYKIAIFTDILKDTIVTWIIKLFVLLLIATIIHNILKIGEISSKYTGEYKHLYQVYEGKMMNLYSIGDGDKTLVILPDFGDASPVLEYKALAERLSSRYRVAIVEYFGYGFSMSISKERTNENIALEIKSVLESAGIYDNYILVPFSTSNIYATYFEQKYPESVIGIASVNPVHPNEINDYFYNSNWTNKINNIKITAVAELTGLERVLSYISPKTFGIDSMKYLGYNADDISVYRNRIASNYLTPTMMNEIKHLKDNMKEVSTYKYPEFLPVLEIQSSEKVEEYSKYKTDNAVSKDLTDFSNDVITNSGIQSTSTILGGNILHLKNVDELTEKIISFVDSI